MIPVTTFFTLFLPPTEKNRLAYLKSNPEIADSIIASSWVDGLMQSLSPNVPQLPDHVFQFVSNSNVKIYPSEEDLYMLRLVQHDLTEYALFLIQKWSKVIKDSHNQDSKDRERYLGTYGWRTASGKEYTPAADRLALELIGRGSLSTGASMLVNRFYFLLFTFPKHNHNYNTTTNKQKKTSGSLRRL
ncbi:MAG: hypothetical protein IJI09_03390 [Clostridia bacterium]|nr:hypothetical protein [Clostridia bacterium]